MYNISFEKEDSIDFYADYADEYSYNSDYKIELIEKDNHFSYIHFLDYEKLKTDKVYRPSSLIQTKEKISDLLNNTHEYLELYLSKKSKSIKEFKEVMIKSCDKNRIDNYNLLFSIVENHKKFYLKNQTDIINNIFKVDSKYIVRYFQQNYYRQWNPTLFELQKWKVKIISPNDKFFIPYTTLKKVGRILINCPSDREISEYTSLNKRFANT
jgi:hypothetical protein